MQPAAAWFSIRLEKVIGSSGLVDKSQQWFFAASSGSETRAVIGSKQAVHGSRRVAAAEQKRKGSLGHPRGLADPGQRGSMRSTCSHAASIAQGNCHGVICCCVVVYQGNRRDLFWNKKRDRVPIGAGDVQQQKQPIRRR